MVDSLGVAGDRELEEKLEESGCGRDVVCSMREGKETVIATPKERELYKNKFPLPASGQAMAGQP